MTPSTRVTVEPPPLVVQEMHRPPAPILRYVDQVVGASRDDIDFRFSQGLLTQFDIDVIHVLDNHLGHLLGARHSSDRHSLVATLALLRSLRRHRIALVRTVGQPQTVASSRRSERWASRLLDRATTTFVVFDEATATPDPVRTTVIPHGHFRDRFEGFPRAALTAGRLLCIDPSALPAATAGLLRVSRLLNTPGVTLRIAGDASKSLADNIRSEAACNPASLSARLETLSDGAQVEEITASELILVPDSGSLGQLQVVFLALSLDRPVVSPRTDQLTMLSQHVGPGWLHLCDGPLTAEAVDVALESARSVVRTDQPRLDGRDSNATQAAYRTVFIEAALRQRKLRRRPPRYG